MSVHPEGLREVIDASVERWADLYPTPDVVTYIADDVTAWLAEHDAALIEGLADEADYSLVHHKEAVAFLRREARQRREGQS